MPKYQLPKHDDCYLTVEMSDGKTFQIPLARKCKIKKLRKLMKVNKLPEDEQFDVMVDFFSEYLGEDVIDDMELQEIQDLYELWGKANDEVEGLSTGESSASQDS